MCAAFQYTHHFVSPLQENQFAQFVYKPRYALNSHSSEDYRLGGKGENTYASKKDWGKIHLFRNSSGSFLCISMSSSSPDAVPQGGRDHPRPVSVGTYVPHVCSFCEGQTLLYNSIMTTPEFILTLPIQDRYSSKERRHGLLMLQV